MSKTPKLSRFELQCLRALWALGEGSVRQVQQDLSSPPGYSTVRKIFERLEKKKAIARVRKDGRAWIYRPVVSKNGLVRREVQGFLDLLFNGSAFPLMLHLADTDELSVEDLRETEKHLKRRAKTRRKEKVSASRKNE